MDIIVQLRDSGDRQLPRHRDESGRKVNESWLLWGFLFGCVGLGLLIYGRKQRAVVPFVCGLTLMLLPYFVANTIYLVLIGALLILACYFIRI